MFWFTFGIAGGLAVSVAAAVATVFTFATAMPPIIQLQMSKQPGAEMKSIYDVNRTAKGDRLPNRLLIHLMFPQVTIPKTDDNTTVNQNPLERTLDRTKTPDQNTPRTHWCELALSPDISPNAARCLAQLEQSRSVAAIN
jgi:hypothetical protein